MGCCQNAKMISVPVVRNPDVYKVKCHQAVAAITNFHQTKQIKKLITYKAEYELDDKKPKLDIRSIQLRRKRLNVIYLNLQCSNNKKRKRIMNQIVSTIRHSNAKTRRIELDFENCGNIPNETVNNFLRKLLETQKGNLTLFQCDLARCRKIQDNDIQVILRGLRQNKNLKNLFLGMENLSDITRKVFIDLYSTIGLSRKLVSMYLDLGKLYWMVDDLGCSLVENKFKFLTKLEAATYKFHKCYKMTEVGSKLLHTNLKMNEKLRKLELNYKGCTSFSDLTLTNLGQVLVKHRFINFLKLNFKQCSNFSTKALRDFFVDLNEFAHLKTLVLNFAYITTCQDEAIEGLADTISRARLIKVLALNFSHCRYIGSNSIKNLCRAFKQLNNLRALELYFAECPNIYDDGMEYLGQTWVHLKKLEQLKLDFSNSENITAVTMNNFFQQMRKLEELQALDLDFHFCKVMDSLTAETLYNVLQTFKKLQSLGMSLTGCSKASRDLLYQVSEQIQNYKFND